MTPDTTCLRNCLNMGKIEIQQQNHVNALERGSLNPVVIHSTRFLIPMSSKSRFSKFTYRKKHGMSSFFSDFQTQVISLLIFTNTLRQVNSLFMKNDNFAILVISKTKAFNVTTSNTRNFKGIPTLTSQIFLILVYWTISFLHKHATVHFDDFLILVTPKTKAFIVTTSNTRNFKGIPTFTSQIFLVLVHWTMSFLRRHAKVHSDDFLILVTSKPRLGFQGHYFKHKELQGYFNIYLTDIFGSGLLDNVLESQTWYSTFGRLPHTCNL